MSVCVARACGAELQPGQKFCMECGTKQPSQVPEPPVPSAVSCTNCGAVVTGRFCMECGTPAPAHETAPVASAGGGGTAATRPTAPALPSKPSPASRPSPPPRPSPSKAALEEYNALLEEFSSDGVLDDGERHALRQHRSRLGIDDRVHERMIAEKGLFVGMPIALEYDPKNLFLRQGSPTSLAMALRNCSSDGGDYVKSVHIDYTCSTSSEVESRNLRGIAQGRRGQLSFRISPPPSAGLYTLNGVLEATFMDGRTVRGRFQMPALKAAPSFRGTGPQSVNINLQGDANMIKGGLLSGGRMTEEPTGEICAASGTWREVDLQPATEDEVYQWRRAAESKNAPSAVQLAAEVRGEPLPCRGVVVRIQQVTTRPGTIPTQDLWFMASDEVLMGRDANRSDVQAAIEPFDPPAEHPENVQQSMRISSCHIKFRLDRRVAVATDQGSANGTFAAGKRVNPRESLELRSGIELNLASALDLKPEVFMGDDGFAHALRIRRVNNVPERSYVLAPGGLGIWPGDWALAGPRTRDGQRAPVVLDWHLRGLCVRNVGHRSVKLLPFSGTPSSVRVGERVALGYRDRVQVGDRWTLFVADIIPLRPGSY